MLTIQWEHLIPLDTILYALCVDQLDSLFDLVLVNLTSCLLYDQSLDNSLNNTLIATPVETGHGGPGSSDPQSDTVPETHAVLESDRQPPL